MSACTKSRIDSLQDFYDCTRELWQARKKIVEQLIKGNEPEPEQLELTESILARLKNIKQLPGSKGKYVLKAGSKQGRDEDIIIGLDYEIPELEKDMVFLKKGKQEFLKYLYRRSPNISAEAEKIINRLKNKKIRCLISDRDGTVVNMCERYYSSVQAVYNSVFIHDFASSAAEDTILLTSGPLDGFLNVTTLPALCKGIIYAGSKARDFLMPDNQRFSYRLQPEKEELLGKLAKKVRALLEQDDYKKFALLGSGFQEKVGELSIARQDISGSVPEHESQELLDKINQMISELDPEHEHLFINDTGLDIEVVISTDQLSGSGPRAFDKGDGVNFLLDKSGLDISRGMVVVCGDTESDLPMLSAAQEHAEELEAIFICRTDDFRKKVLDVFPEALIVSGPDSLIVALEKLAELKANNNINNNTNNIAKYNTHKNN